MGQRGRVGFDDGQIGRRIGLGVELPGEFPHGHAQIGQLVAALADGAAVRAAGVVALAEVTHLLRTVHKLGEGGAADVHALCADLSRGRLAALPAIEQQANQKELQRGHFGTYMAALYPAERTISRRVFGHPSSPCPGRGVRETHHNPQWWCVSRTLPGRWAIPAAIKEFRPAFDPRCLSGSDAAARKLPSDNDLRLVQYGFHGQPIGGRRHQMVAKRVEFVRITSTLPTT